MNQGKRQLLALKLIHKLGNTSSDKKIETAAIDTHNAEIARARAKSKEEESVSDQLGYYLHGGKKTRRNKKR